MADRVYDNMTQSKREKLEIDREIEIDRERERERGKVRERHRETKFISYMLCQTAVRKNYLKKTRIQT